MNSEERPFLVDKPLGATPLEALVIMREILGLSDVVKLAYAGRLDPMASGLLVALHGSLLMRQEEYWHLDKTYEATMLLGIGTDSYDVLGLAEKSDTVPGDENTILAAVQSLVGKTLLSVPMYSSHRHEGKPLFQWAREDGLVAAPVKRMAVSEIEVGEVGQLKLSQVASTAIERCRLVNGDFRQRDIIARWEGFLDAQTELATVKMTIKCSSGTYIRSLAHELGRRLGTFGMLFDLRRTTVGQFRLDDPSVIKISWPR